MNDAFERLSPTSIFLLFYPVNFIKDVVIPQMNRHLMQPLTYSEYVHIVGVILLMSCYEGVQCHEWFMATPPCI